MNFKTLSVCLDMYGCPNRCAHCWLGNTPNGNLTKDDRCFVAEQFRPYTNDFEILTGTGNQTTTTITKSCGI